MSPKPIRRIYACISDPAECSWAPHEPDWMLQHIQLIHILTRSITKCQIDIGSSRICFDAVSSVPQLHLNWKLNKNGSKLSKHCLTQTQIHILYPFKNTLIKVQGQCTRNPSEPYCDYSSLKEKCLLRKAANENWTKEKVTPKGRWAKSACLR